MQLIRIAIEKNGIDPNPGVDTSNFLKGCQNVEQIQLVPYYTMQTRYFKNNVTEPALQHRRYYRFRYPSLPAYTGDGYSCLWIFGGDIHNYGSAKGWVQIHILGSNTNTTRPNQIQILCLSIFQYKYKFSIQIHCHFYSNSLPFFILFRYDSNMCFHYSSSVSQWVEFCLTLT